MTMSLGHYQIELVSSLPQVQLLPGMGKCLLRPAAQHVLPYALPQYELLLGIHTLGHLQTHKITC